MFASGDWFFFPLSHYFPWHPGPSPSFACLLFSDRMTPEHRTLVRQFMSSLTAAGVAPLPDVVTALRAVRFAEGKVPKAVLVYTEHAKW